MTGELNEETLKLMNTPRCGVKDPPLTKGMPKPYVLGNYQMYGRRKLIKLYRGNKIKPATIIIDILFLSIVGNPPLIPIRSSLSITRGSNRL